MCSESLWWRCYRRLQPHRPSDGLRLRDDGLLVYDSGQPTLL
jgi:hypothetical protein